MKGSGTPIFELMDAGDMIYNIKREFRFVFIWSICSSIWIIASMILLVAVIFAEESWFLSVFVFWLFFLCIGGFILGLLGPKVIMNARRCGDSLENFLKTFRPIWYKLKFEMMPAEGDGIGEQIAEKVKRIYPEYKDSKIHLSAEIRGKKETHRFESMVESHGQVSLVKAYTGTSQVTLSELGKLRMEIVDVREGSLSGKAARILRLFVAADAGFEPAALDWAIDVKGLQMKDTGTFLTTRRDGNFTLVAIITPDSVDSWRT